jgi:hypothetical protein
MIRKFNYTDRSKIRREDVRISTSVVGQSMSFSANFAPDALNFPKGASIYIEPYYRTNYLRFQFGSVGNINTPPNTDITELRDLSEAIYFRIKVVNSEGLLLGFADKLPLTDDNQASQKSSILYVNPVKMETDEIWRVSFDSESSGMPVLEVNNKLEDIKELSKTDPNFVALVFPAAIRLVLERIVSEKYLDGDEGTWYSKWLLFSQTTLGVSERPGNNANEEDKKDWIDNCVRAFNIKNRVFERYAHVKD